MNKTNFIFLNAIASAYSDSCYTDAELAMMKAFIAGGGTNEAYTRKMLRIALGLPKCK